MTAEWPPTQGPPRGERMGDGPALLADTVPYGDDEAAAWADQEQRAASNGKGPRQIPDAAELLAGMRNGTWLGKQVFPPLTYVVPGVIPEGSVLLVGPPKVGKSWFVLTVCLAAVSGGRALGIKVDKRPVLLLALEDGDRRLQDRCRKLLPGNDSADLPGFDYITRLKPGRVIDTVVAWLNRGHDAPPLVVLDTLGKVMPPSLPGESAYQRDYRIGSALKELVDEHPGMTLLTNHHDRKADSADFIDSVSGTHGLAGSADTIIVLSRARHEEAGLLKVTGRDIPESEYAVVFEGGHHWQLDGEGLPAAARKAAEARATAGLGGRAIDVVELVRKHPKGITPSKVAEALGMDPASARTYLSRAVESGRLHRTGRGIYVPSPVASVASVASDDDEPKVLPFERNTRNTRNSTSEDASAPFGEDPREDETW